MPLEIFQFPTGEMHYRGVADRYVNDNLVYIPYDRKYSINDWIMAIMLYAKPGMDLFIPYLPYSRQDRPTSNDEPFSLKVFGNIINSAKFRKVYTLDVHSDVAHGCIDNLVNIPIEFVYSQSVSTAKVPRDTTGLVVPDQGAYKRLSKLMGYNWLSVVTCIKERSIKTGHLEIKHVIGDVPKNCIIVDDICDGGMTFILLARALKERGAETVDLFVTHGVFSKGRDALEGIRKVYTTDSFPQDSVDSKLDYYYCESLLVQYRGTKF